MQSVFSGAVYVVRDNIDTDQIIPAQYLNLVPTIAEEYEKLGSFAFERVAGIALSDALR
jgi:3-isopropylmalate/(R)-2-methylmalate dehydratase small subunit